VKGSRLYIVPLPLFEGKAFALTHASHFQPLIFHSVTTEYFLYIMDPASALGLAVNILAIVQLTGKIIHAAIEIRGSVSGLTEDDQNLESMMKDMETKSKELSESMATQNADEDGVRLLARECQKISGEVLQRIEKTRPKNPNSKMSQISSAFREVWSASDKRELEDRLKRCRDQLTFQLLAMLRLVQSLSSRRRKTDMRQRSDFNNQSAQVKNKLEDLVRSQTAGFDQGFDQLDDLRRLV
jgi:hypothetical protein